MLPKASRAPSIFADPVRNQRVSLEALLDTVNCQGPKPVELLSAILAAVRAELWPLQAGAVARLADAASMALAETICPGADPKTTHAHIIQRNLAAALPGVSPELLSKLERFVVLFPSWRPDGSGRVDNPPSLARTPDAQLNFSQDELHCLRHLLYAYLPVSALTLDFISRSRRELLGSGGAPAHGAPPLPPRPSPPLRTPRAGGGAATPPCALITVGPVGSGKSWLLHARESALDQTLAASFGSRYPAPPVATFSMLDPDSVLHAVCASLGQPFNPALRSYANFCNHENFSLAVGLRRNLIFDGSGRDPTNICGRVISRLRPAGYRIVFLVVLTSFETARRRAVERQRRTGRETSEGFTRFVYKSLQRALPIYLRSCDVQAADGVLVFTNDVDGARPRLECTLAAATGRRSPAEAAEHASQLQRALALGREILTLPPGPSEVHVGAPAAEEYVDDDTELSLGEMLAAAGVFVTRLRDHHHS